MNRRHKTLKNITGWFYLPVMCLFGVVLSCRALHMDSEFRKLYLKVMDFKRKVPNKLNYSAVKALKLS